MLAPGSSADRHTTAGQHCKTVCILENVAGRNDEDTTTHCVGWRGECEMSRSLVTFIFEDHPHCKQLSGQDNLGNFSERKRRSMSICTTPTNNSRRTCYPLNNRQPCREQLFHLFGESISPQHRNDDHLEDNPTGQNKMKRKLWCGLSPLRQ